VTLPAFLLKRSAASTHDAAQANASSASKAQR
jgi:hypothetical protein